MRRRSAAVPLAVLGLAVGLLGCADRPRTPAAPAAAASGGGLAVTLSNFAFTPDHLVFRAGVPVRLHLVNASGSGHDFSAPALFAASRIEAGAQAVRDGAVEVPPHGTVDLTLTPLMPGMYDVVCTHPLHELFGMTGSARVLPAAP